MINNPKTARIIAVVVIAMLVITLAASLFGCAAAKPAASDGTDPESGLKIVAVADGGQHYYTDDHYKSFRRITEDGGTS